MACGAWPHSTPHLHRPRSNPSNAHQVRQTSVTVHAHPRESDDPWGPRSRADRNLAKGCAQNAKGIGRAGDLLGGLSLRILRAINWDAGFGSLSLLENPFCRNSSLERMGLCWYKGWPHQVQLLASPRFFKAMTTRNRSHPSLKYPRLKMPAFFHVFVGNTLFSMATTSFFSRAT